MLIGAGIGIPFQQNVLARLLGSAEFFAPLTHSAIPTRAASGTTGTFTRATTSTWPNNDGYLVTGVAGEIGFVGARRVRNLVTASEDLSNAAWSNVGSASHTAGTVTFTASASDSVTQVVAVPGGASGKTVVISMTVSVASGTGQFRLQADQGGVANGRSADKTATTTPTRFSFVRTNAVVAGTGNQEVGIINGTGAAAATFIVTDVQLEDVTAQTTQTAGEYVSVGVPSDWAGDELVTNGTFDTDTTGWTLSNATAAVSSGEVTLTNTAAAYGTLRQAITTVVGTKYILSGTARVGSATIAYVQAGTYAGAGDLLALSTSSSSNTFLTGTFTATGTTTHLSVAPDATSGHTAIFDNISVKPAYYHGSMVDGVKCFPTDLSGNPIPSTTMLGYQAQGARTNLCLQSNAFNTTWIENGGTLTCTQNATGPDGGTTAWMMTDDSASAIEGRAQAITLTAAAHTFSVFVKKTSGATTFPAISALVGAVFAGATIDTNNGTATVWASFDALTPASGMSARCYSHNTDFWRAELTFTGTAAAWTFIVCPAEASTGTQSAFTGAGAAAVTGSAVFYGAQVELGSFASSYIATTTIAVTRNADVLTYSSAGNILGTVGWAYAELSTYWNTAPPANWNAIGFGASIEGLIVGGVTGAPTEIRAYDGSNSVTQSSNPTMYLTPRDTAMTWGGSSMSVAQSGVATSGSFDGNIGTTAIGVGNSGTGTGQWNGTIRNVRIGQRALSSSELQAVTA